MDGNNTSGRSVALGLGLSPLAVIRAETVPVHRVTHRWPGLEVGVSGSGAEIYLARDRDGTCRAAVELDPAAWRARLYAASGAAVLGTPLDRFVIARLLADQGRVIVHAAGLAIDGVGLCCPAVSGGGKTTLSRLAAAAGLTVLSDERVVVGASQGESQVWGTPWAGEGGFTEPGFAPLARVLFLEKAATNALQPVSPARAAAQLLSLAMLPYWSREATDRAVAGVAALLQRVPAAWLRCTGDRSSIDFLADLLRT